jgi:hypothetical protein
MMNGHGDLVVAKKPKRLVANVNLEPFYQGVDEFCRKHIPNGQDKPLGSAGNKIIADPVEGYSSLDSWEMSIIDTPLFQRLRGIRQLGLAYLVYPTLGYSRFEHVIGVRARLDQVVTTLRQNEILRGQPHGLPTDKQFVRMKLAVLSHDIGHCMFSHVSEDVIESVPGSQTYPSALSIRDAFKAWAGRRIPMSEILSVSILTSPSFIEYLDRLRVPECGSPEGLAHDAAHIILGLPIPGDPSSLFLAQLMNSGLDIDKLDYMLREALLSGISLGISLQWLMKKLFIGSLSGDQLPEGLRPRLAGFSLDKQFSVLSLERGGQFAFEEFCVARLALHEKIYLHQKIRAAEVQTKKILSEIAKKVFGYSDAHRWLYLRESMVHHPEAEFPDTPSAPPLFPGEAPRAGDFEWSKIRDRNLLTRAYAFGWQNSIADPVARDYGPSTRRTGIDNLMELIEKDPARFTASIRENLRKILRTLDNSDVDAEAVEIFVDPPNVSTLQQGNDTIHFEYPPRLSLRWTMPIDLIEDYYWRNRALGYVFTTRENVSYVLLATEMAAFELYGVVCIQEGLVNRDCTEQCRNFRTDLDNKGFYVAAPPLRPISDFLAGVGAQLIVTRVAKVLELYESKRKSRVSPASVTTFVAQFPAELQAAALAWLEHIDFIKPEEQLKSLIPRVVHEHLPGQCKTVGISPLGATTDSAYRLAYGLRESLQEAFDDNIRAPQVPLAEALNMGLDAYVVFDDNTNSGLQALNIVAGWLECSLPDELKLREEHVEPLSEKLRVELLSKPVLLVFSVATEGAVDRLKGYLVSHCGMDEKLIRCDASKVLGSGEKTLSGPDSKFQHEKSVELRKFLAKVAKTIFLLEGKSDEVAESRALGGGGAEAMVVFPYNCPTMTIPALWLSGEFGGSSWIPLVERGRRTNPKTGVLSGEDA